MPFEKGKSGNPKGKIKGTKNKDPYGKTRIKEYFENGGLQSLLEDIEELEDRDKVNAKLKLIEYYIPKQKEVHNTHEMKNETLKINLTRTNIKPITSENDMHLDD